MAGAGVDEIWEVGAGKALSGMIRRIARDIETKSVGTPDDVRAAQANVQYDRRMIRYMDQIFIDPDGTFVRPEHSLFLTGNTPSDDGPAAIDDFSMRHEEFEEYIWPSLWNRIPQFDAIKVQQSWTGHSAYNTLDQNAIVGPHPEVGNFFFVNGFSGHGLQQSPAIGRGMAELLTHGAYRTLDLSPFAYDRVPANRPLVEKAVI